MADIEIGIYKSGRRAYGFDDIAIVPSRRTRDPEDVDISWDLDAFHFELPLMASAMDGVVSPATAMEIGRLGGVGVLNLEGLWTRYEDPDPLRGGADAPMNGGARPPGPPPARSNLAGSGGRDRRVAPWLRWRLASASPAGGRTASTT